MSERRGRFAGERAVVVGLGASGLAAARVLAEEGAEVLVSERRPAVAVEGLDALDDLGVRVRAGGHRPEHLAGATLVVVSPGVPERTPVLRWAHQAGVPVWSELELGARLCRVPYVAITGTNGKTTTTEMVAAAMREAGIASAPCGNIGYPFSLAAREDYEALVVEASSFQLRFHRTFRPKVSVLLNLSPDHLDWHGSFEAYAEAKARVFALQRPGDVHVGNRDDPDAARLSGSAPCGTVWFRLGPPEPGEVGYLDGEIVSRLRGGEDALGRPLSTHAGLMADAAAAAAAALSFGLDVASTGAGIASVGPLPHRGEVVARVGSVRFVDDSKATNPHATLAALSGVDGAVLIAGGQAKGVDLSPLVGL
ncbi:MAG: UDP-N-acetylmuramoyl-L-alanine--D-glutamate ligase, partial [Actinobacteria bacterium]|nr:UDP-N-acetylmuramoyl-L-alanine--D-glutamate ligase [Actinomycetota bacterium]